MKRAALFGSVLAACSALVIGCSSGQSGDATPSSSAAPSSAPSGSAPSGPAGSSAAATSSAGTGTSGGAATSEDGGTTTDGSIVAPTDDGTVPDLDAPTTAWFDTFCSGLSPLATLDLSDSATNGPTDPPDPADPDNAIQKQSLVSSLNTVAAAFADTSKALAEQEPPSFDGGADFATAAADGLRAASGQLAAAVATFDAVPASATDTYWTAKAALRTQSQAALAPLQALAEPPAEVQSGVRQIPSCQALGL